MATTATVRSNQKDNQGAATKKSSPAPARQANRAGKRGEEKVITFATTVIGSGFLGVVIGGGWGALAGVAAGVILALGFARK